MDPLAYMRRRIDQGDDPDDAERATRLRYGGGEVYIGTGKRRGPEPRNAPGKLRREAKDLRTAGTRR